MSPWFSLVTILALTATGCFPQHAPHRPHTVDHLAAALETPDRVEFLDLTGKSTDDWPADMAAFTALTRLSLRKTGMTELPAAVRTLPALVWLDLGDNPIAAFPAPGLLPHVVTLYLSDNNLTDLPASIGSLTQLAYLNLDRNRLTALPEELGRLESLKWLRLNHNRITTVPDSLGQLKNLKRLYLQGNPLTEETKARLKTLLPDTDLIL